ncbi:hypothetical protein [Pseudomonas purpurea]|uniref:hypothetical protein n=1 Tax=Pseudomonas purpurea TaxID=3136737 RepID=UPI00326417E4
MRVKSSLIALTAVFSLHHAMVATPDDGIAHKAILNLEIAQTAMASVPQRVTS